MKLRVLKTPSAVSRAAAQRIAEQLGRKPGSVLGLPTGRTSIGVYYELSRLHKQGHADFSRAHTVNIDELVGLPPRDDRSFCGFMRKHLFSRVNLRPDHIHFLDGSARDLKNECRRFEEDVSAIGGIDLLLLGIGANGHIAFNEPARHLEAGAHPVRLKQTTRRANRDMFAGQTRLVPRVALTMGIGNLLEAREILLIATGAAKARAVSSIFSGKVSSARPASFLQLHGNTSVILDTAAAEELSEMGLPPKRR